MTSLLLEKLKAPEQVLFAQALLQCIFPKLIPAGSHRLRRQRTHRGRSLESAH